MVRNNAPTQGVLELHPKGHGFLRNPARNYAPQSSDAFVSGALLQKHRLREGLLLSGPLEFGAPGKGPRLARVDTIEGKPPGQIASRNFDQLTATDPTSLIRLETGKEPL